MTPNVSGAGLPMGTIVRKDRTSLHPAMSSPH